MFQRTGTQLVAVLWMWSVVAPGAMGQTHPQHSPGNDHVVTPCQAAPAAAPFFTARMTPQEALARLKAMPGALKPEVAAAKAFIVHVTEWNDALPIPNLAAGGSPATPLGQALARSEWAAFDSNGKLKPVKTDANGNPVLFNQSSVALIGVTHFSQGIAPSAVTVAYTVSTTPLPQQNITDLVALLNALAGASGTQGATKVVPANDTYLAACLVNQDTDLPLTINLGYAVTPTAPPAAAVAAATTGVTAVPASVDFGSLAVGTPAGSQTVTVTNKGSGKLTFTGMPITGTNAGDFAISGTDCNSPAGTPLATSASCTIHVRFTPSTAGARGATLSILDDAANSPQTVALTGTGTGPGAGAAGAATAGAGGKKGGGGGGGGGSQTATQSASKDQTNQGSTTPSPTGASPTDCTAVTSAAPCSISRSVVDYDKEYWDIGLGLALPGVPERTYDPANLTKKSSTTMHTDVYAFVDLYFNGNRNSAAPHLVVGVPTASQPLHRQAYAMSFPLTTWLKLNRKVPFTLCGVVGVAVVKEYHLIPDPNGNNGLNLKTGWTGKWFFGVELPLNQLVGRVSKIGK